MSGISRILGRTLRAAAFVLTFTLEVHVRAEPHAQAQTQDFLEEPSGCLRVSGSCALRARAASKLKLVSGDAEIAFDQNTTVLRENVNEMRLIEGTVWVKASSSYKIKTEYGSVTIANGEAWVARADERVVIATTRGVATLSPRGTDEILPVPAGFESSLGRVGRDGKAVTGLPTALVFKDHLARWARLYSGKKSDFEKQVAEFHAVWAKASREAAELHQELFNRKIAAIEEEKARKAEARRKAEDHDRALRALFRQKVFDGLN